MRGPSLRTQKQSGCQSCLLVTLPTISLQSVSHTPEQKIERKRAKKNKHLLVGGGGGGGGGDFKSKKENKPTGQPKYRLNIY